MHRLAQDAERLAGLRVQLQHQVGAAEKFITDYSQHYNANESPTDLQKLITDEFELSIKNRFGQLDQTVRDLLQIVSINIIFCNISCSYHAGVCLGVNRRGQNLYQASTKRHATYLRQHLLFAFSILCCKYITSAALACYLYKPSLIPRKC